MDAKHQQEKGYKNSVLLRLPVAGPQDPSTHLPAISLKKQV